MNLRDPRKVRYWAGIPNGLAIKAECIQERLCYCLRRRLELRAGGHQPTLL